MDVFDAAKELFGYNRESFFFDSELRLKREYQEQNMRVKQFVLYREDIRDLTELTTAKMDSYLLVALLELGCCFDLLVHGILHVKGGDPDLGEVQPTWLLWLYVISLAEAFLYLFLSAWFAIHASVAAHSFAVRLLTQFVRLPVPDRSKLDAARAYAAEFEGGGVDQLLRVPVLGRQIDNAARALEEEQGGAGPQATSADIGMALASLNQADPNPTSTLKHVKLYRDLQSNWQAHDAYARACLALGTYTLVHAVAYYVIGHLVVHLHSVWPALGVSIILPTLAWLLIRLDLYFNSYLMVLWSLLLMLGPLLAWVATLLAVLPPLWMEKVRGGHVILVPVNFLLHVALIVSIVLVARADRDGDRNVALPTRFRTVLYLDVFGWVADPEARAQARALQERRAARGGGAPGPARSQPLPPQLQDSLRAESGRLAARLQAELRAWGGRGAAESLEAMPGLSGEVRELRAAFERAREQLAAFDVAVPSASGSAGPADIWLRMAVDGGSVEFFVSSSTGEVRREAPEGAQTSDVSTLRNYLGAISERCELLQSGRAAQSSHASTLEPAAASSGADEALFATWPLPGRTSQLSVASSGSSVANRPPRHSASVGAGVAPAGGSGDAGAAAVAASAQETRFGGSEAAQVEALRGYSHSPATAQTFHPRRDGRAESRRPPGQVPWVTFLSASVVVGSVWLAGAGSYGAQSVRSLAHILARAEAEVLREAPQGSLLLGAGAWPRRPAPLEPVGLACHAGYGPVAFLVERFGVHEIQLDGAAPPQQAPMQSTVAHACLAQAPDFHAAGFAGASLDCPAPGRCSLLLLSADGGSALRCPLVGRASSAAPVSVVAAKPDKGAARSFHAAVGMRPSASTRQARRWTAAGRQLPRGRRWAGACAWGGQLYAAAAGEGGTAPELWGFRLAGHGEELPTVQ